LILLVLLALAAGGLAAYQSAGGVGAKSVQLRTEVRGKVDTAVQELKGLIEDNTQ
jgi:hypothetical protein